MVHADRGNVDLDAAKHRVRPQDLLTEVLQGREEVKIRICQKSTRLLELLLDDLPNLLRPLGLAEAREVIVAFRP